MTLLADSKHFKEVGVVNAAPTRLRITSTSNSIAMTAGYYRVAPTCDVYYRQHASNTYTVAVANASFLAGGAVEHIPFDSGTTNVAAITDGGSGYIYFTALGKSIS